ncbi:MAG TPA: hypothetical protein VEG64_18105 [Candidatus Sulfotelmatobacter sp.]|nr:hypothetical protein [Candidatus Sulfotelmatobacter sp.]
MIVYFTVGGVEHAYIVPVCEINFKIPHVGPGPVNYPPFLADASVLASLEDASGKISDAGVREALRKGIMNAVDALQKRGGVRVSLEAAGGAAGGR